MKRIRLTALLPVAFAFAASPLLAENASSPGRGTQVVRRGAPAEASVRVGPAAATAEAYSVQVNIVTRVQGSSFFKTALDITNNTNVDGVVATYQYCYTYAGVFQGCTLEDSIQLLSLDNFHSDDFVAYLDGLGLLVPGAGELSFGTLLVTFTGLPTNDGWEGTVTARTYSPYSQANPSLGTVAIAYPGSLFFESANTTLVGTIRDTQTAGSTEAGILRTNIGVTNTALNSLSNLDAQISFYDVTPGSPTNGQRVGGFIAVNGLGAGEVRQFNNVFDLAGIPANIDALIAFIDVLGPAADFPSIEGYIVILDGGTQDGAYFEMKCADLDPCAN